MALDILALGKAPLLAIADHEGTVYACARQESAPTASGANLLHSRREGIWDL